MQAAPLHDIGKIGIPERVLFKRGPLDAEDCAIMKTHVELGSAAIEQVEREIRRPAPFLSVIKQIARSHHERWDGGGYPDGLAGEAIPACARIVTLADALDALISSRPYKQAVSLERARDMIARARGLRFDPDVTDAFLDNFEEFVEVAEKYPQPGQA